MAVVMVKSDVPECFRFYLCGRQGIFSFFCSPEQNGESSCCLASVGCTEAGCLNPALCPLGSRARYRPPPPPRCGGPWVRGEPGAAGPLAGWASARAAPGSTVPQPDSAAAPRPCPGFYKPVLLRASEPPAARRGQAPAAA